MKKFLENLLKGFKSIGEGMGTFKIYPSNKVEVPSEIKSQNQRYWKSIEEKYERLAEEIDKKYDELL